MDISILSVIGGDERSAILASKLAADGYTVFAAGFDKRAELTEGAVLTDHITAAAMSQAVVLPVMPTTNGLMLSSPLSDNSIPLDSEFCDAMRHAKVFTGFAKRINSISPEYAALSCRDYSRQESFLLPNAKLTAESAVMLALERCPMALYDTKCLITGYGRIGKALAPLLRAMGARVLVCARKSSDLSLAGTLGFERCNYSQLPQRLQGVDLVFNTADALVINENIIKRLDQRAMIFDLASAPGGVDEDAARRRGITASMELGLPGKYSPVSASKIIKDTVLAMIEEENQ